MATTPPPYGNITGIYTVSDKHQKITKTEFDGNARPGQLVIDTSDYSVWVGNADGALNAVGSGGGGGTGLPGGPATSVQFNDGGVLGGTTNLTFNKTSGELSVKDLKITGNVTASLLPNANVTYDLGSSSQRWKDLWLSNTTIHLGPQSISAGAGNVVFSGNITAAQLYGNATYATSANIANIASVAYSVAGANITGTIPASAVSGNVANAAYATSANTANTAVTVTANAQPNITSVGTLTSLSTSGDITVGGNLTVTGTTTTVHSTTVEIDDKNLTLAAAATTAAQADGAGITVAGASATILYASAGDTWNFNKAIVGNLTGSASTVTDGAQPNITSVGTLSSLDVVGPTDLGDVANVTISGGSSGQVLTTDGSGGLSWGSTGATYSDADVAAYLPTYTGNVGAGNIVLSGTTSMIESAGTIAILPSMTVDLGSTRLLADITPVNAQGGNVGTAILPFFGGHFVNLHADNIIGDGGNLANIAAANVIGVVSNAIHAVNATTVDAVDGGTVYGQVGFAATANAVAGANVSGQVANAVIADTALSVAGIDVTGEVANANFASFSDYVVNATQSNITAVGTLVDLTVTGDATAGGLISLGGITATGNANVGNIGAVNAVFTGTGSFAGNITLSNKNVTNMADPVTAQDAATKNYVDTLTSTGISYHPAVAAATTTTLAVASTGTVTYNNGTAGVGATLTTTGTFTTIDSVNIAIVGTRVLVKNEVNAAHNGVYQYTNATTLTRTTDTDNYSTVGSTSIRQNVYFFTLGGSTNVGVAHVCSTVGAITMGTTAITFSQFSTSQVYTASTGITIAGAAISVNPVQSQITTVGTLGTLTVTGNTAAGNLSTAGVVAATGNITGGNITTAGIVTATGNVTGGNLRTAGVVAATGNVSGGNLTTAGRLVATGNVTGGNLTTAGVLSVTGNANIGNIGTATLTATGSITAAGVFTGNGSGLTDIVGANMSNFAGNVTVAAQPNITSVGTLTSLAVTGNISGGNIAITSNIAASNIALNGQIVTPNITVTNRASLGSVDNVRITGGNATEFLTTDGLGNLSWASPLPVIGPDVTANLDFYPLFALANTGSLAEVYTSAAGFRYNPNTGTLTTGGLEMSNIQANVGNITVVNSSTVNAGTLNGSTVNGTNVVTPTVTAKTAAIEIKSLGVGDIKFTTVTGNVTMTNPTLFKNLLDPDQPQDAATKHYTDAIAQGLDPLVNARVATTGTLASITGGTVTYNNGTDGVGATLTLSVALTTVDGVTLANGNRILVHLEADAATNGVYVLTSSTVLTRATDNDDNTELVKGNFVFMAEGTLYGKVGLAQTEVVTTVGTDPVNWVQFAAAPNYVAGAGIYITGAEIKVDNTGVTAGSYGGGSAIPVLSINSRGQITSASTSGISAPAGGLTGNRIHSNVFYSNLQTVGTLENLTVSGDSTLAGNILSFGNVTAANADLGNLAVANFFQGDGGLLSNLQVNINKIDNGTSELVVDPNAAVRAVIDGDAIMSVTTAGLDITGAITTTTSVSADTITATTSVTAPDFIGRASSANTADIASQVTDATQSNITTVGTLTSLDVAGVTTLGLVGNVKITGGTNGQILRTDGTGNLTWASFTATTAATVTTNAQPNITSVGTLTSLAVTGNISGANITGAHYGAGNNLSNIQGANVTGEVLFAATANAMAGANVSGAVAFATTANAVAGANVSGAVALSVTTNSVDGSNVFGQVANALVAGTVYEAAQPNITSVGTLASVTVTGTSTIASWEISDTMITSPDLQLTIWQDGTIQSGANKLWMRSMSSEVALISVDGLGNSATVSALHDFGIRLSMQKDGATVSTMTLDKDGNLSVPGSLRPTTDGTADLGADMIGRWGNLYLKEKIRLGFTEIQAVPLENEISINGNLSAYNIFGAANLMTLEVGATANLGEVANVTITGGVSGQVLTTNGSGALSWTFPRLPNFADDAAANTALGGTPSTGMMYFDTALDTVKVYKSTGWTAI